ncbi:hypothetical protein DFH11DRAFT_1573347 [Phellopilus nigrolimitatus]|nr:hypothetical protein DFH11DRAFT_1573347 [Phellopilus nigrolimitatus]
MGAGQSKPEYDEQVFLNETPIQFSQDVAIQLAETASASGPPLERQSCLDVQIQSRIHAELSRLRQEEEEVRREIELTLEKENLDHEVKASDRGGVKDGETDSCDSQKVLNSTVLLGDLEEVRQRVERLRTKQEAATQDPALRTAQAVYSCYKSNSSLPLDCWREVGAFKASVAQMEQDYIASFR